jgi:dihydroorotate dehydrogenase
VSDPYRLLRPALFRLPPERAHALAMRVTRSASSIPPVLGALKRVGRHDDPRLAVEAFGVRFPNPIGVGAGLDKDADALPIWEAMGFGHVEIGTVTALPQPGNPRPRAHRLIPDRAIVNAMGFPSVGAVALAARLEAWRRRGVWPTAPVGINVGKSRVVPIDAAEDDYRATVRTVAPYADFLVVNVSSPNTPNLRELQDETRLARLVGAVAEEAGGRPVLVKLAPDMPDRELARLGAAAEAWGADGLVLINTTVGRAGLRIDPGARGGLSGRPLAPRARQALAVVRPVTRLPIVSVGGIDGPAEAIRRFEAGADLIQVYTGLIYEGPGLPGRILAGLSAELDRRGASDPRELRRPAAAA